MDSDSQADTQTEVRGDGGVRVQRALLSVSDKTGIADFGRALSALGVELLSTGIYEGRAAVNDGVWH